MSSMTLNLDGDALREATVQAMIGVLTPEVRAKVLETAIQNILTPSTNSWDKKKSPIEIAFEQAAIEIAREEAKRMVAEDGALRSRMRELLRTTADKVLTVDIDKLAERMATSFAESMRQ